MLKTDHMHVTSELKKVLKPIDIHDTSKDQDFNEYL